MTGRELSDSDKFCPPQPETVRDNNHHSPPPDTAASAATPPHAGNGEWPRLKQQVREVADYFSYYLEAQADLLKLQGRRLLTRVLLGIAGALGLATALVVAITLVIIGVAQGLAQVFANHPWLGPLITGLVILGSLTLGAWGWLAVTRQAAYNRMVEKYEQRKSRQRARFGHDIVSRAEAPPTKPRAGVSEPPSR